jgi:membrane dipeptidase
MEAVPSWIDGHLDLAYLAVNGHDVTRPVPPDEAAQRCVSLPSLRAAGIDVCFATIFVEPGATGAAAYAPGDGPAAAAAARRQVAVYAALERRGEVSIVREAADLRAGASPRIVILMEGADPIAGPDDVAAWVARGVRIVGLAWSQGTRYAGGNATGGPLTPAGAALVRALDDAGVAHDASHLGDDAFDALLAHARGPIVATHSNARALMGGADARGARDLQRHLSDAQIRAIGERGGVVGLNLFARFLARDRPATLDDCVRHVEHVAEVMGHRRGVGLGSDMDGGFGPSALPAGLDRPERLGALAEALSARGWSDEEVHGFRSANWRRWLESRCFAGAVQEFVSEPIEPAPGTFHTGLMTQGLAGLPGAFRWRGRRYEIVECLEHVKQSGPEGGRRDGETYLRRQRFRVRLASGEIAVISFERQPRAPSARAAAKRRWYLSSIGLCSPPAPRLP